jgi:hypothetical protein
MMRISALSIATLAAISLGTASRAGASVVVESDTTVGRQVFVFFSASKTVKCKGVSKTATVYGDISGAASIARSTGVPVTRSNAITMDVFGYSNDCTGASFGFGSGGVVGGLVGPGPLLDVATMNTSTTVQDFDSGKTMPVVVHLTVTGSGPLTSSGSTTETHTVTAPGGPFTLTITRTANSNRSGTVTGTFSINGDVFDLGGTSATFNSNSNATITVTKP